MARGAGVGLVGKVCDIILIIKIIIIIFTP